MKTTIKQWLIRSKQSGQSIIEVTLITPLMLIALYIPADLGMAFLTAHLVQNAVREGARIGSGLTSGDPGKPIESGQGTAIKNEVFARLPQRLSDPSVQVKFHFTSESATCMQVIEVVTTGTYNFSIYRVLELTGVAVAPTMSITRTTQMRYNYQRPENDTPICASTGFDQTYSS